MQHVARMSTVPNVMNPEQLRFISHARVVSTAPINCLPLTFSLKSAESIGEDV